MAGDFVFQSHRMAEHKFTSIAVRTAHVAVYTLCMCVALFVWNVPRDNALSFLLAIFVSHWITDSRRWASGDEWPARPIMVDQSLHIIALAIFHRIFLVG